MHYELDHKDKEEGSFVIDSASGVIRTNKALDRESVAIYDLRALAIDGGTPPQSSSVSISKIPLSVVTKRRNKNLRLN